MHFRGNMEQALRYMGFSGTAIEDIHYLCLSVPVRTRIEDLREAAKALPAEVAATLRWRYVPSDW